MSHHRRPKDREGNADHDRPIEIQGVRETRGGVSYDLCSSDRMKSNKVAENPMSRRHTLVFHRTDRKDFDSGSETSRGHGNEPVDRTPRRDQYYTPRDGEDRVSSDDLSMPRLERNPSRLRENDSYIDDLYISTNPHPLLDEGRYDNASRPRTLMSRTFGAESTQPGRGECFQEYPRVDTRFSDRWFCSKRTLNRLDIY